jgi:hypothetical protein
MAEVIAGPAGHWYALQNGELVCLPMNRGDNSADLPAHPDTLSGDESFRVGWYSVDFGTAFDERNPADRALVIELREIERELTEASTAAAIESTQFMPDPDVPEPFEGGDGTEPGPAGGGETLGDREAATWDDANGSECQHCGGQIPPEREHCPDCEARSEMLNDADRLGLARMRQEQAAAMDRMKQRAAAQDDARGERDR